MAVTATAVLPDRNRTESWQDESSIPAIATSSSISFLALVRQRQSILDAIRHQRSELEVFKNKLKHTSHLFNE